MIGSNPAARVKPPSEDERPRATVITPEQVEAIRAQMSKRDAVFVSVLAYAGLRPHEALALTADQLGGKELHLEDALGRDGSRQSLKSGHDQRDVPICKALAFDLASLDEAKGLVFTTSGGNAYTKTDYDNWRKRRFYKALEKANEKIVENAEKNGDEPVLIPDDLTPYDLRHSICSLWYRQGIDKATIAAWLGHSVPVLEKVYTHHFKMLDPLDRRTVDEMIAAARS